MSNKFLQEKINQGIHSLVEKLNGVLKHSANEGMVVELDMYTETTSLGRQHARIVPRVHVLMPVSDIKTPTPPADTAPEPENVTETPPHVRSTASEEGITPYDTGSHYEPPSDEGE